MNQYSVENSEVMRFLGHVNPDVDPGMGYQRQDIGNCLQRPICSRYLNVLNNHHQRKGYRGKLASKAHIASD